jgi:DNA repair exonuclease SbcCD nuclease subunit
MIPMKMTADAHQDDILIVHSSDLHVDDGYTARAWGGDGNAPLAAVLETARAISADIVLLTGDIFEHNRLKTEILGRTRTVLEASDLPVVMLPGNHDPLIPGSVWDRGALGSVDNVHVLGEDAHTAAFPDFGLEIWGRAHTDYDDVNPLAGAPQRSARWHVVAGHGHYAEARTPAGKPGPSWLFTTEDIEATGADYVALGHWNRQIRVGSGTVPAWYSGSPDYARTVNVVRLRSSGAVDVTSTPVRGNLPA